MAACLIPKARPWRSGETSRASNRWVEGWETAFPSPPKTRHATSPHHEPAKTATAAIEHAPVRAESRIPLDDPILSTTRPETTEKRAEAAKNTATRSPSAPAPKPSSPRIWTARPPVRKGGSIPAVATATARSTGR